MDGTLVAVVGTAGMLILLAIGIPVGLALGLTGFLGLAAIGGPPLALAQLQSLPYNLANDYAFAVVPTFVFMGNLAMNGGMARELYTAADRWFGHIRGGLYLSTIAGSTAFGAASGSTLVNATVFTKVALPEMLRLGYSKKTASACIASVGTLAAMIPPSVAMVVYGILTEQSIGKLMVAGILPGLLTAAAYCILMMAMVRLRPELAPRRMECASWSERWASLRGTWAIAVLFLVVVGGIYLGFFSPTASGAAGAFGALVILLLRGKLTVQILKGSLISAAITTSMLFIIIIGGLMFSRMLVMSGAMTSIMDWVASLKLSHVLLITALCAMYIVLGCLTDAISMLIVTLPFVFPIVQHAGLDPIWFGILCVQLLEIGAITPPVGLNLYATVSASNGTVTMEEIVRGIIPFVALNLIVLTVLALFPQIALWLPSRMKA
ncbi:MAG: TRAP transporter large permease [Betaproteobacteria bacterium]|nr:MAG: TRAP transporter large permease [Betaproteobacteria bacterium]